MPVVKDPENGKFNFICDHQKGENAPFCGFSSYWWDTEKQAVARGEQHANEHETGEPMQPQAEFEVEVGFRKAAVTPQLLDSRGRPVLGMRVEASVNDVQED